VNPLLKIFGRIMDYMRFVYGVYKSKSITEHIGGGRRFIGYPYNIKGVENIVAEEPISIGPNSTIYSTRAKVIIKSHFLSGPNLTIITGDHRYFVGHFMDEIKDDDKLPENDQDVIIEEDVWCGSNVSIMKGVTIGRGSIVGAGSVVTKSCPPYSIIGGIPARVIKQKFTDEEIKEHERILYTKIR